MKFGKRWVLAASVVALSWTGESQAASFVINNYNTSGIASGALVNNAGFSYSPFDLLADVKVGGIRSGPLGSKFGAEARATIGAVLKVSGGVNLTTSVSTSVASTGRVVAASYFDATNARSAFSLINDTSATLLKSTFGKGDVKANLSEQIFAGARISGKACVVGCVSGNLVDYSIGNPDPLDILKYDSTTNSVTFLGNTTHDVLPRQYNAGGSLPISVDVNQLNLSGSTETGVVDIYHSQQRLAGAFVDVAGVIASKFGVPQSVLQGSALGFNYTTISAKVGIALNAVYDATVSAGASATNYLFSTPMEFFRESTSSWVAVGRNVTLPNQIFQLRPADASVQAVAVLPIAVQAMNVSAKLDLQAALEDHVRILELHGNGLDAGPLLSQNGSIILGSIGQFTSGTTIRSRTALQPFLMDFRGGPGNFLSDGTETQAVANVGYSNFLFIPSNNDPELTVVPGSMVLVTNFGTFGCNDFVSTGCIFDPTIDPVMVERQLVHDAEGNPQYSFSTSFEQFDAFGELKEGTYGEQWSNEALLASLQNLPPPGSDYNLPDQIAFNTDPWLAAGVPEPANWALMIAGFGLTGTAMRRRAKVTVTYA